MKNKEKENTYVIIGLKNTEIKDVNQELKEKERERKTIDAYAQTINVIINLKTHYSQTSIIWTSIIRTIRLPGLFSLVPIFS